MVCHVNNLFGRFVPLFFERLPNDRECQALEAIGDNTCAQTTSKQTDDAIGVQHHAHGLIVCDRRLMCLFGRLDDA